jgi:hypothetical protein
MEQYKLTELVVVALQFKEAKLYFSNTKNNIIHHNERV